MGGASVRSSRQIRARSSSAPEISRPPGANTTPLTAVPWPHLNWKTCLLERGPESDHAVQFGRLLGTIHRRAAEQATVLRSEFGDLTFFDQLRLEAYYRTAAAKVPA